MPNQDNTSDFLQYLARSPKDCDNLPSLAVISKEIGISVAALREQLEVAKALGFVEVRPRTGIKKTPYNFSPSIMLGLNYLIIENRDHFLKFADLRQKIEFSFWNDAVVLLDESDIAKLQVIISNAFEKLNGSPIQIPHEEHKKLHLTIYSKLNNPFVSGILESYWKAYELIGLNFYTEYAYLRSVWDFHKLMVDSIVSKDFQKGYDAMTEHVDLLTNLLDNRPANGH